MTLSLDVDRPPVPPGELILRVACSFEAASLELNRQHFDEEGFRHLQAFERALALIGKQFEDFDALLDFGCGCGRFLRHLRAVSEHTVIHGIDIDKEMLEWCVANIPFAIFNTADHEPPLPYPDGSFDLVINHSVFTHLDEHYQDMWLADLQRITRPGAILLLTVEGTSSWNRVYELGRQGGSDTEAWRDELERNGILYIADDHFVGSTHPDFYHSTVHAPWYVFEHWTRLFDLVAYVPDGSDSQDLIILRRRPDGAPAPPPISRRTAAAGGPDAAPVAAEDLRAISRRLAVRARATGRQIAIRTGLLPPPSPPPAVEPPAIERELQMMRAGLYEQGRRISVIAAELRAELDELRNRDH